MAPHCEQHQLPLPVNVAPSGSRASMEPDYVTQTTAADAKSKEVSRVLFAPRDIAATKRAAATKTSKIKNSKLKLKDNGRGKPVRGSNAALLDTTMDAFEI